VLWAYGTDIGKISPPPSFRREGNTVFPNPSASTSQAQSARFDEFPQTKPTAGEEAPDFSLMTLEGEPFDLHEAAMEKPVVLEFGSFT
jgi:hypothetical protein